jgi:hypothetical protein
MSCHASAVVAWSAEVWAGLALGCEFTMNLDTEDERRADRHTLDATAKTARASGCGLADERAGGRAVCGSLSGKVTLRAPFWSTILTSNG